MDEKAMLKLYLQRERDALLWKTEGLSERELRMPRTRTGSNLLGILKHVATVDVGYFGALFGRPLPEPLPWGQDDAEDNADMWATADQSAAWVRDFAVRAWAHSDVTIDTMPLDTTAVVPWWGPERRNTTLRTLMVHMTSETARHAGHMDILRELADGSAGKNQGNLNLPPFDDDRWAGYTQMLRQVAESFPQ
ncbi:DinB family protein [Acidipropionibacterium acidipropionici]|uniref:DinB family protein n=1 Tax=Acidipropionibacterium acidipropionici TaxID=1748 RepID=A0AAC8YEF2_9ACTN|nr:DinB family protein [Acidipropionibacterium acidipropionici]AMS04879.1 hypothetical protein AXH35_04700 [Acidipropionibacterium acidipropionici]AOZ46363.1 hypothetical protein A8L58_06165 [Acidipropionibacterium acidipropionici]AZP37595.1 DinB family protein [Acidipropionibacterium acidipropionici]